MSKAYVALIADAIDSRRLAPAARARLQTDMRASLHELNKKYHRALAARFAVTLGDEIQCLLVDSEKLWEISHYLRYKFDEVDWVVSCGRGPITTHLTSGITAPEVDGPCFHDARSAMETAKHERRVLTFAGFANATLEAYSAYYSALYWSWTARQRRLASKWRAWDDFERALPARVREGLHPSAISHLRRRMGWPLVAAGDKMLKSLLEAS